MPGLLYERPYVASDAEHSSDLAGNYFTAARLHSWELLHRDSFYCRSPLVPSKHKACKPSHSQVSWILKGEALPKSIPSTPLSNFEIERSEKEHDLADMVHDFIENGCQENDEPERVDNDNGATKFAHLCERLKVLVSSDVPSEKNMLSVVTKILLGIDSERDLICHEHGVECRGICIRELVAERLNSLGHDAALCKLKWQSLGQVPGGEYEYVDVLIDGEIVSKDRLIIDLDFKSQFEIARPTEQYVTALNLLPTVFIGRRPKLEHVLQIMSEAAKFSLSQNCLYLPPWRTFDYMCAKWLSPHERTTMTSFQNGISCSKCSDNHSAATTVTNPQSKTCSEHLRLIKEGIASDSEKNFHLNIRKSRSIHAPRKQSLKWF